MDECIFCQIINKTIPAKIVFEDEEILAFEDINPQAPVHILIIPKQHFASLNEISENQAEIIGKMVHKGQVIARDAGIMENGYRIVLNTGKTAGQEVFHIHFHLLGGRPLSWPPG